MTDYLTEEKFITMYLGEASERLRTMEQSVDELTRSRSAAAVDALLRCAHSMKGMSAMMGYTELASVASDIERYLGQVSAGERPAIRDDVESVRARLAFLRTAIAEIAQRGAPSLRACEYLPELCHGRSREALPAPATDPRLPSAWV